MDKMYSASVRIVNNKDLHDDYLNSSETIHDETEIQCNGIIKNKKGENKMARQIAQASSKQNVTNYFNNKVAYKGVNKMAKQIAMETERKNVSQPVLIDTENTEAAQIQRLTVDMPSDLHKEFKVWCVMNNMKMNELIRDLIRETIKA